MYDFTLSMLKYKTLKDVYEFEAGVVTFKYGWSQ